MQRRSDVVIASMATGGYNLNGSLDKGIAVLSISTFELTYTDSEYPQEVNHDFQAAPPSSLPRLLQTGERRSWSIYVQTEVIAPIWALICFKLFFPGMEPYQATRSQAHQPYKQLVDLSTYISDTALAEGANLLDSEIGSAVSEFYYQSFSVKSDGSDFVSATEFYGLHSYHNDNSTSLRGWNFSTTVGLATNATVADYGGPIAQSTAPFNAFNILLLQDGACSSTCAIFSELMRTIAGVETLAIGGLPDDATSMQKVGGTKGWLTWNLEPLAGFSTGAYSFANETTQQSRNGTEIEAMNRTTVIYERCTGFQVNAADSVRKGDSTGTPLQFVYEAGECRIWCAPQMVFDVSSVWEGAANTRWGNGTCNAGAGWGRVDSRDTMPDGPLTGSATGIRVSGLAFSTTILARLLML